MEIRQLRHFIAAAEAGNLRKASETIHISHAALSMSLKNLENDLGVALLHKNKRGVQMTYAGKMFLKSAHSLLRQIDDLRDSLQSTHESPTGEVLVGIPYGANNALAAPLFKLLLEKFPGIDLEIEGSNSASLERAYENNMIDMMINYDFVGKMDQRCEKLYIENLYFVTSFNPALQGVDEIEFSELVNYAIVSSPGNYSLRKTLDKYAMENSVSFNFEHDFRSAHASLKIAEAGLGNTIASWDLIHDRVATRQLSARKIVHPEIERTVCLVSSLRREPTPAVSAILGAIKEAVLMAKAADTIRGRAFFNEI